MVVLSLRLCNVPAREPTKHGYDVHDYKQYKRVCLCLFSIPAVESLLP